MPTGTVRAVLNGPTTLDYHYAPVDPAYNNPLAHYFAHYLPDSNTGRVLWQNDLHRLARYKILVCSERQCFTAGRRTDGGKRWYPADPEQRCISRTRPCDWSRTLDPERIGVDDQHIPGGIVAAGSKFIFDGGGSIEPTIANTKHAVETQRPRRSFRCVDHPLHSARHDLRNRLLRGQPG